MHDITAAALDLAQKAFLANASPRYQRLDALEGYVAGTQYDGRPKFFDDAAPLLNRAPCIVFTLAEEAIRSHASMVIGEGRFPRLTTCGGEDDTDLDPRFGTSADESAILDPFVRRVVKHANLQPAARRLLERALESGSAVAIACVRDGRLAVDVVRAKTCTPTFDPARPGVLTKLEIRFPFLAEEDGPSGQKLSACKLFRRVIDAEQDITYRAERADRKGGEPTRWIPETVYRHGFGFVPAIWYRCMGDDGSSPGDVDGHAIHERLLDELYALDLANSQIHRAAITTLDPIMVEIGVDDDFNPAPTMARPDLIATGASELGGRGAKTSDLWGHLPSQPVRPGRKRAPGMAYQYPNEESKVSLLTLPGDALDAGFKNADRLFERCCDLLHYRPIDPKTMQSSALSGRALEWLHKRQLDFDNELRTDFAHGCLLPLVSLLLRVVLVIGERGGGLYLPGVAKVLPILQRFRVEQTQGDGSAGTVWMPPEIECVWGPYFPPTAADEKDTAAIVREDFKVGIIDRRTALQKLQGFYGIRDVDAYLSAIEAREEEDEETETAPPSTPTPPADPPDDGEDDAPDSTPAPPVEAA